MTSELHPLAQDVKQHLDNPDDRFMMLVYFTVEAGREDAFKQAFHRPLQETVKEEGNCTYRLIQQANEPTTFIVIEHWKSLADLNSHLHQPYLDELLANVGPMLAAEPKVDVFHEYVAL
ncbi:putative quinol monooxygenase [Rubinisphaera margarita]|uniref:putative quinol monooxygenase n=1 Tax=Rubinisphaera margarita TaxID=2909586 RepID=UPI001EE925AF|nr:putative quinol monooxygenase [Rubinisphaera margarita]MCG6157218.1 antibiotic biosynthesis monooxygenase [Rubinisphaera margarita]